MKAIPKLPAGEAECRIEPPDSSDEHGRLAELVLQHADDLADRLRKASEEQDLNYRSLFDAAPGESRDRIVWRGIVDFASTDYLNDGVDKMDVFSAAKKIAATKFLHLLKFFTQSDLLIEDFLGSFSDVQQLANQLGSVPRKSSSAQMIVCFAIQCRMYQPQFKRLLTWLCDPPKNKALMSESLSFLGIHASGVKILPDDSDASFDESAPDYCPVYYWKTVEYRSLMSPICKFILDRIENYHDWLDRSGNPSDEKAEREKAVPIHICERVECGRLFVPQRTGRKKFCTKRCCDLAQPGRSDEENRDYMWLYRMERHPASVLRGKMNSPVRKKRLDKIATDWPELADRVAKIKKRASK